MDLMNLVGKVGNIVKETGKQVGGVVTEKTKEAKDYAKDAMEIANLKNQIATCKDTLKGEYIALGEYYYKKYEENPEADVVDNIKNISTVEAKIKELEAKIEEIKYAQAEIKAAKAAAAEEEAADIVEDAEAVVEEATDAVDEELANIKPEE